MIKKISYDELVNSKKNKNTTTNTGAVKSGLQKVSYSDLVKRKQEKSKPIVSVADYESKANSWLKNSAGYLSTWEDEYTTDYFSNRKSQAAELREQGKTLLSQLEQNRSTLGDNFVNEFKSYYDEYDTHLTNYESYYNQDPYMVKYKDSSITELAKSREGLLQNTSGSATAMVGLTTPSVALDAATFKKSDAAMEMEALDKYQRYLTLNGGLAKNETDKIQRTAAHIEDDEYYKQKEKEAQAKAESGSITPKINMLPEGFEESKDDELDIDSDGKVSVKDATLNQLGELSDAEYYKLKAKQNKDDEITALGEKFYNAVFNEQREREENLNYFDLSNAENVPELEKPESEYSIAQLNRYLSEEDKQALTYIIGEKVQDWYKENAQLSGSSGTQHGRYEISYENQSPFTDKLFVSELNEEINKYLAAVKGELRYSSALESFKNTEDKPLVQVIDRAASGIASAFEGVYNSLAFGNIDTADTDMEIYKQMIDEDLGERGLRLPEWLGGRTLWQSAGDLAESAGNMLPSQLLSVIPGVGPVLSSVIFGMGTGGNAKRELMKEGYDETTATIYGVCVGVAEAGLERLMGSIPGLGSEAMEQLTEGIKNGVLRAVANLGVDIAGEAIEEMSQEALEPVFRYIAGIDPEEIEAPEISDIFYAGFQGAVMSFGGNAVSTAIDVGASIKNQSSQYSKPTSADIDEIYGMVEEGLSRNKSSEAYAIAAELHNKMDKEYSKAYYRNISQGGSDTIAKEKATKAVSKDEYNTLLKALMSENEAGGEVNDALEQRLVQLGEKGDVSVLAQAIYQYQKGVELSEAELTAIKNSSAAMKTLSEYRQAESGGFTENWTNNVLKSSRAVKGESELKAVGAKNATTDDGVIKNRTETSSAAVKQQGGEAVSVNNVTADTAARSTELPNGVGVSLKSGSIAGIVGVEYSDGGSEARYRTSEGTVISAEEIAFDGGFEQNVIEAAPLRYSTDSANALISAMASYKTYAQSKGAMASSAKLMSSFEDLRNAGLKGMTYEQAAEDIHLSGDVSQLGETAARIAINDGLAIYESRAAKAKAKAEKKAEHKKAPPKKGAVTLAENVKNTESIKANMPILKKIAQSGNVAIVIEKFSGADKYAKGFYSGGVIHLNADRLTEGGFTYTGIHESVHYVSDINYEGYKAIEKFIKNYYKEKGVDIEAEIKATQNLYKQRGKELTRSEAMEEIVCNTLSDIATDEDALTAFLGLDSKTQNNFIEALKAIARKLKEWATKCLKGTEYHSIVINDADTLLSLAKKLRAELEKAGQKNNTATLSNDVKYNLNKNAREEVHKALYDKSYNGEVLIRDNTPSIMLAQKGVRDLPMVMKVSHIRENIFTEDEARQQGLKVNKNINYHGLGEELFLNVLDGLDDVTEAYRGTKVADNSSRRENYFLLISKFSDTDGNIINVPVYIEETALSNNVFFDTNKISTVYGKEKLREYIQRQIRDKNLVRIKNRSNVSSESNAPIARDYRNIASNGIISNDDGSVNSNYFASFDEEYISAVESGDTATAQRLVDSAAEAAMKESKIRDKSGKLVKVYHGSDSADFYEFDKARRGQTDSSMYGRGYYFAFDPDYSSDFGENVRAFYLDIKNPYYIDINAPTSEIADFLKSKGVEVDFDYSNMISHFFAKNFGSQKFTDTLIDLGYDGVVVRTDEGENWETVAFHRNQMKLADPITYDNDGNVIPISERFSEKRDVRYSFDEGKITIDMSEQQRYELLKKRTLQIAVADENNSKIMVDGLSDVSLKKNDAKKLLRRIAEEFNVFKDYENTDIELSFEFGKNNLDESINKQKSNYQIFAQMMTCFSDVISNAIGMEVHNRNSEGYKVDRTLKKVYVLCSAFENSDSIIPVKLSIKEFSDKPNRLYVAVALEGIKKDRVVSMGVPNKRSHIRTSPVTISISEIFKNVNKLDVDFIKYIPKQFFEENVIEDINKDVRYSFGEEELHYEIYTKGSGKVTEELRKTDRAMGTLLKLTQNIDIDFFDVNEVIRKALRTYGVPIKALNAENDFAMVETTQRIFDILSLVQNQKYIKGDVVTREIALAIKHALKHSKFGADVYKSEREEIVSFLKDIGSIYLTEDHKAMLKEMGLSEKWFKQSMYMLGKVTVTDRVGAISLDDVWISLSKTYPQWFDPAVNVEERPVEMIKGFEELKPQLVGFEEVFVQGTDVIAIKLANKVLSGVIDLKYNKLKDDTVKSEVKKIEKQYSDNMQKWLSKQESQRGRKGIERIYGELYKKLTKPTKKQSIPEDFIVPTARLLKSLGLSKGILDNRATKRIKNEKGEWITVPNDRKGQPIIHDTKVLEKGEMLGSKIPYGLEEKMAELNWILDEDETQPFAPGTINENLLKIVNLLKDKELSRFGEGYDMDIDLKLIEDMTDFAGSVRKQNIYDMTAEETSKLHSILFRYRNTLASANRMNSENISETLSELGWNTINELNTQGESKVLNSQLNKMLFYDTADALTVFERFGEAGMKIYRELRGGFDKYTLDIAKVRDFSKKHLNSKNVRAWMKQIEKISLADGQTIELSGTEIMNIYCLNERNQARGHLYENKEAFGEIVVKDKKGKDRTYRVTESDINTIISKLNEKQKDCCEEMIKFLSEDVAEWGNEVTMRRYLYRAFTVERYFPIIVDGMSFKINDFNASETASFWGVANPKASKQTQGSVRKPLIIQDVFDVFAQHCGDMAMYHGMGEAVMDAMKWYNYSPGGNNSVRKAMSDNLSKEACQWFETFIKDLNGAVKSDDVSLMQGFIRGSKSALIWMNLRVVIQQPTAYIRALNVIDPKYLVTPKNLDLVNRVTEGKEFEKGYEKALKYCPIVMFKSWGYFSNDIGKSTKDMMLDTENFYEKAKSIGFWMAGKADMITLGWLWNACEKQVADKNRNLKQGSEEFNKAVAELLTRVVDETQVVDTPFHRSQIRRKKTGMAQVVSAFMDEPIKGYNMIMRAILSGDGKKVARALVAHVATVTLGQCLMKALYDLLVKWDKDEDEDGKRGWDDFFKLYLKNLVDDLNPLNMHPYLTLVSDLAMDFLSGVLPENDFINNSYSTTSLESAGMEKAGWLITNLGKLINPDKEVNLTTYGWIYKTAEVVGTFTGIGVQNVMNFVTSIWNRHAPVNLKLTKTDCSNTYIANAAVKALVDGDKKLYEELKAEIEERVGGDTDKTQRLLANALSTADVQAVKTGQEAADSGDKELYLESYNKLIEMGFDEDVAILSMRSLKSQYSSTVKDAAEASVNDNTKAYDEAIAWLRKYDFDEAQYEADIAEKKEELLEAEVEAENVERLYDNQMLINTLEVEKFSDFKAEVEHEIENGAKKSSIKTAVTKEYKLKYYTAFIEGDDTELARIERIIEGSGLYADEDNSLEDITVAWLVDVLKNEYVSAYSINDTEGMKEARRRLLDTGKWDSLSELDAQLEKWKDAQQGK